MKDITHNKSVEDNLKLAATVYQASGAAMLIMDAQYNILNINPAFTDITGFSFVEIEGKSFSRIYDSSFHQTTHEEIFFWLMIRDFGKGSFLYVEKLKSAFLR